MSMNIKNSQAFSFNDGIPNQKNLHMLPQGNHLLSLMTILRDSNTNYRSFCEVTERIGDKLISAALDLLPYIPASVKTPTGAVFEGTKEKTHICAVSILRAGASLESAARRGYRGPLCFGKILIQRDEKTCLPKLFYSKLPASISSRTVLILEPMLATGGSACAAIEVIKANGVPEENIVFVNIIAARRGVTTLLSRFPSIRLVTAAIDDELTSDNIINPGLGDFGDRFYGTES